MQPNPFKALLMSRKFWMTILDLVVSATIYFVGKYAAPQFAEDVKYIVAAIQPVFLVIIGSIAWEDAAEKGATTIVESDPNGIAQG
jgi:hypothetical protein